MKSSPWLPRRFSVTKQTPGPWHVATYETFCAIKHGAVIVATQVAPADAPLLAAAPAMLAALRMIETCLRPDDNDAAASAVRNAIAQAEAAGIK